MSSERKVECRTCAHFRSAPFEARIAGCYFPPNMVSKQSARYLDEQQIPGDHRKINLRGDCPDHQLRTKKAPIWRRLW